MKIIMTGVASLGALTICDLQKLHAPYFKMTSSPATHGHSNQTNQLAINAKIYLPRALTCRCHLAHEMITQH